MKRAFVFDTSSFGRVSMTRAELYQLHREVSRAATLARLDDPKYVANQRMGVAAAQGRFR